MPDAVIFDTSALIALEKIDLLPIVCRIYDKIILPEAVIHEFGKLPFDCYSTRKVEGKLIKLLMGDLNLGKGESEVITLANEIKGTVVIDDAKARKVAENLGLEVTGTIGILLKAEKLKLIESAYAKAKELKDKGFYLSDELLEALSRFTNH